jgi:hypothetical protein
VTDPTSGTPFLDALLDFSFQEKAKRQSHNVFALPLSFF